MDCQNCKSERVFEPASYFAEDYVCSVCRSRVSFTRQWYLNALRDGKIKLLDTIKGV